MKLLIALNYYYPYVSGLSEYARRMAEGMVKNGHEVTVVTLAHDKRLPKKETTRGVHVIRCSYLFKLSKGLISPSFIAEVLRQSKRHDKVNLHLPMMEAGILALLLKQFSVTYHCDLTLKGFFGIAIERAYYLSAGLALQKAARIITYTNDYARHSVLLQKHLKKCKYALPVVDEKHFRRVRTTAFRKQHKIAGTPVIGFAGRLVFEKGLEHFLRAIPLVLKDFPDAQFALAGEHEQVAGGSVMQKLQPLIGQYKERIHVLGNVAYDELPAFYSSCDVLVLPSIDRLEAFGIVQVEAMLCGTPVIATDLPGVRVPVQESGNGKVIAPRSSQAIAEAVRTIIKSKRSINRKKARCLVGSAQKFERAL